MADYLTDAKYCAAVYNAANKYNKYGINVAPEVELIGKMEEDIKYNVHLSDDDLIALTNRVFFLRYVIIRLSQSETEESYTELFKMISRLYRIMGELIIACYNGTKDKDEHMDKLLNKKMQLEVAMKNFSNANKRLFYDLMYTEVEFVIKKYYQDED